MVPNLGYLGPFRRQRRIYQVPQQPLNDQGALYPTVLVLIRELRKKNGKRVLLGNLVRVCIYA